MRVCLAALLVTGLPAAALAEDEFWRVAADQARCFFDNIAAYRAIERDPVIIFLETCPDTGGPEETQRNMPIPALRESERGEVDDILVFTQEELACLEPPVEMAAAMPDETIVELPKDPECPS